MLPDSRRLLLDMLQAAKAIQRFVQHKVIEDLQRDELLRSGIYYQFVLIGEALSQISRLDPSTASAISEFQRSISFRNQIIHGYARIDDEITWRIVEQKLPVLLLELQNVLK
jgi:uncharacterized protein with HEPN domain